MSIQDFQRYLFPLLIAGFFTWRFLKFKKAKALLPEYLKQGAIIVDVRSSAEFNQGARPGSVNIPFNELNNRCKELDKKKTIILCCASGTRSGVAVGILKINGFKNIVNIGSWRNTLS